jgi:D-aminoacyl-tRNA deacylase
MKALIQRVAEARVDIRHHTAGSIAHGMLVFLGVEKGDAENDLEYLVRKISNLRVFEDSLGKMNLSLKDIRGEVLVVSQFTLSAECRKGNRPSFDHAEEPVKAQKLYFGFIDSLKQQGLTVESGEFGANMQVHLVNDGPVTILIDSKPCFKKPDIFQVEPNEK